LRLFPANLDTAEEAFQGGLPQCVENLAAEGSAAHRRHAHHRGRNSGIDAGAAPEQAGGAAGEGTFSDLEDVEASLAERLDSEHYRDDILRLLFIWLPSRLPATQQIALALRIGVRLSVKTDRRAFPGERTRPGAAHHPRQKKDRCGGTCPSRPGRGGARCAG